MVFANEKTRFTTITVSRQLLPYTVAYTCYALLIALDNINTVCEIGLYTLIEGIYPLIEGYPFDLWVGW